MPARERSGVRREAKCHAALDSAAAGVMSKEAWRVLRKQSKAPSPLRFAGALQNAARAGDAVFATLPFVNAQRFGVRREAKRHAAFHLLVRASPATAESDADFGAVVRTPQEKLLGT